MESKPEHRCFLYLNSFERISFEWDTTCRSSHLEQLQSVSQLCAQLVEPTGKVVRATNNEHCFKSAFGTEELLPSHRYCFAIKCIRGTNFKFGIATEQAKKTPNNAFSDTDQGFAYFSTGSLRHASKGSGVLYGDKFRQDDVIGVYVDLVDGILFFSKNGDIFTKNAFQGTALLSNKFYPAAACLSRNEMFELIEPQAED